MVYISISRLTIRKSTLHSPLQNNYHQLPQLENAEMQTSLIATLFTLAAAATAQFAGPCTNAECGSSRQVCGRGLVCVGFPTVDAATRQDCTCSGECILCTAGQQSMLIQAWKNRDLKWTGDIEILESDRLHRRSRHQSGERSHQVAPRRVFASPYLTPCVGRLHTDLRGPNQDKACCDDHTDTSVNYMHLGAVNSFERKMEARIMIS